MNKSIHALIIFTFLLFSSSSWGEDLAQSLPAASATEDDCSYTETKSTLLCGWYEWRPYQYSTITAAGQGLSGIDVEFLRSVASKIGVDISYIKSSRPERIPDLKSGTKDVSSGGVYTAERATFLNFSIPYRDEAISLFKSRYLGKTLKFSNVRELLTQMRIQNFRLGVVQGVQYPAHEINDFASDKNNADIVVTVTSEADALARVLSRDIDGYIADRITGADMVLGANAGNDIEEVPTGISIPAHLMFSKKTVSLELVEQFNDAIAAFIVSPEYQNILRKYLRPVVLLQTVNSQWFYIFSIISMVAFALSGIAIGVKENATLFVTLLLAIIPSVGGNILRDVVLHRNTTIFMTPIYMYYVLVVTLVGFAAVKVINSKYRADIISDQVWDNMLVVCDAAGQAALTVIGVIIVLVCQIEPLELFGPFFAFVTANGGCMLRDLLLCNNSVAKYLFGGIQAEVSILWGVVFVALLSFMPVDPDPDTMQYAAVFTMVGAFVTKLLVHYYNVPNLRFKQNVAKAVEV